MESAGRKLLIIEDSRADRRRFYNLCRYRLGILKERDHEFAWAWERDNLCGVLQWFYPEDVEGRKVPPKDEEGNARRDLEYVLSNEQLSRVLLKRIRGYGLILLDLAWSRPAENEMQRLQLMPRGKGKEIAEGTEEQDLKRLRARVEGIMFLDWWRKKQDSGIRLPDVWVTSAYVPHQAVELRDFLWRRYSLQGGKELFHKWMDEDVLIEGLRWHFSRSET